jgi:hypothetical protein
VEKAAEEDAAQTASEEAARIVAKEEDEAPRIVADKEKEAARIDTEIAAWEAAILAQRKKEVEGKQCTLLAAQLSCERLMFD